jgi:tRNA pseudouridine55 synthase
MRADARGTCGELARLSAPVPDGVIVAAKPQGLTSHDVVNRVRRITGIRRIGHLGTLDPLAEGVLPLVVGQATRLAPYLGGGDKEYLATIRFGYSTSTYDRDGERTSGVVEPSFSAAGLESALGSFRGAIRQTPPPVSAKKVGGVPAYKLARKGTPPKLEPVEVTVHQLELRELHLPTAVLLVRCTAGTYVRAIAHELGQKLGCGAVLEQLRRTVSGPFDESQSHTLDVLAEMAASGRLAEAVLPCGRLLPEFPAEVIDPLTEIQVRQGRNFRISPFRLHSGARLLKAVSQQGDLVAIAEAVAPNIYHPVVVFQKS